MEDPFGPGDRARHGLSVLGRRDFEDLRGFEMGLDSSTPLFFYILREAELMADGLRLGPIGSRIVAEVIIGLLQTDPSSYLTTKPDWRPTLPTRAGNGDFPDGRFPHLRGR